jgi:hypothetical protein
MNKIESTFSEHVHSVKKLMNFDRIVVDLAIKNINELHDTLKQQGLENSRLNAERTLTMFRNFHRDDSLRPQYQAIFNQALVLLVSYFASSVHDLFRNSIDRALVLETEPKWVNEMLSQKLTFTPRDIKDNDFNLRDVLPEFLIQSADISFQDMQSIKKAFEKYLGLNIERDQVVNNIILGQACRHVIVHSGGVADEKLTRQLRDAMPRNIKTDTISSGEPIQFSEEEVNSIAASMTEYIQRLCLQVEEKFKNYIN